MISQFQCRFRKEFNTQHFLLLMIEKWREIVDNGGQTGAVLTDLSKAFDMFFEVPSNIVFVAYADDNTLYNYCSNMQTVLV